jgi:hypothetical protein
MAGNLSDYAEKRLLDHILGTTSYTKPTVYVALFTADPGEAGPGTEVSASGTAYERKKLSATAATEGAGSTSNSEDIVFPVATANYGSKVTHVVLLDSPNVGEGNQLWHAPWNAEKTIEAGDQFVVEKGKLVFSID